jgi:dienelactone hydrolase
MPGLDLRDMLRRHLVARSLDCMRRAENRRADALRPGRLRAYQDALRAAVRGFYPGLPAGPVPATLVSAFEHPGFSVENLLFDSFPGWQVNASVFVPLDFAPPYPAVVIPVGHSGKQFDNYQLPAQYFARCGYLAVLFDPPGQASEKQPGNDHFIDGVRPYLTGDTSSRYFVADALRCIDYLETRPDADLSRGVAMTGVSGGGTTTTLAGLLDGRIAVLGPSCCVTPLADLDITQGYAGCPETHMWRRYAEGVDEVDLLCASVPKPLLLMAGEFDEVFHIDDTRRLAAQVAGFYGSAGASERFAFYVDPAGHCYSLDQARQFVLFTDRWLRGEPGRAIPAPGDLAMLPADHLRCRPRLDVNMRSLTLDRSSELAAGRGRGRGHDRGPGQAGARIRSAAADIAAGAQPAAAPEAEVGQPFQVWAHDWQPVLLKPEPDIALPATLLLAERRPAPAVLHFDDAGRHRLLLSGGLLAQAARFLERGVQGISIMTVDLRGWGDSTPALYPYEVAGWGSPDRTLAYMSNALGDPLMAMRIRDGLAALAYLRTRPEIDAGRLVVSGCGLGGLVALHVAAIDGGARGVVAWDCLASFQALLESERYAWPADAFVPNVLLHYDLPELAAAIPCRASILRPLDGERRPLPAGRLDEMNQAAGRPLYEPDAAPATVAARLVSYALE